MIGEIRAFHRVFRKIELFVFENIYGLLSYDNYIKLLYSR